MCLSFLCQSNLVLSAWGRVNRQKSTQIFAIFFLLPVHTWLDFYQISVWAVPGSFRVATLNRSCFLTSSFRVYLGLGKRSVSCTMKLGIDLSFQSILQQTRSQNKLSLINLSNKVWEEIIFMLLLIDTKFIKSFSIGVQSLN